MGFTEGVQFRYDVWQESPLLITAELRPVLRKDVLQEETPVYLLLPLGSLLVLLLHLLKVDMRLLKDDAHRQLSVGAFNLLLIAQELRIGLLAPFPYFEVVILAAELVDMEQLIGQQLVGLEQLEVLLSCLELAVAYPGLQNRIVDRVALRVEALADVFGLCECGWA